MSVIPLHRDVGEGAVSLTVQGAVTSYRLHDVGYALDLAHAARLLEAQSPARARPTRGEAKALIIAQPPLTVPLGPVPLPAASGLEMSAELSACCFDFGVISLRLRVPVADGTPWADLLALARRLERSDLGLVFGPALGALVAQLRPAIERPAIAPVVEDYTVWRFIRLKEDGAAATPACLDDSALAALLLGESRPLTEDARRNLLSRRFSYTDQDLTVLSWDAALVAEPLVGDQDVEFLLEFANAQLLELRVYDAYLDAELPQLYDRALLARRGATALLVRRFENVLAGLHTMVADTTEVVERVENGLKVTNDVYLARIYQAALTLFREEAWRNGLARKLQIFRDTYAMLNDEAQTARGNMLEVIIILLIVTEVILGLLRH
jgi:hypothetical protein